MAPTGPHRFKTRFSNLPFANRLHRPPLISVPSALAEHPLPSAAHPVEPEPAPGIQSQHASVILPAITAGTNEAAPPSPASTPTLATGPAAAPSPIATPSSPDETSRRPPRSAAPSDELETLRDSQYNTESEDGDLSRGGAYELSAEEMRQFDRLAMELEQEGRRRRRPLSDPSDNGLRDTVRSSYPINIDEWAVSPPPTTGNVSDPFPPNKDEGTPAANLRPPGTTKAAAFQISRLAVNGKSGRGTSDIHARSSSSDSALSRSNSFPRSKSGPRTSPRRSPPPPITIVKESSGTHSDASETKRKRRDSDDSVGVTIEDGHTYPALSPLPGQQKTGWEEGLTEMHDIALTPAPQPGERPKTFIAVAAGAAAGAGAGLSGILKNVGSRSTQWVSGHGDDPAVPKQVRITTPQVATSGWSSSVLPSPGLSQRKSPAQLEFSVGAPSGKRRRKFRLKKFKPWQNWCCVVAAIITVILVTVLSVKLTRRDSGGLEQWPGIGQIEETEVTFDHCLWTFTSPRVGPRIGILYPCRTCVPLLKSAPNDFVSDTTVNWTGVGAALQYCAMSDLLFSSDVSLMHAAGWGSGTPCMNWTGVECDARGRIRSLDLTYPHAPVRLPASLENLVALDSFRLVGDGQEPSGDAAALGKWKNLTSLDVQYTGLIGDINQDTLPKSLRSITLVSNPGLRVGEPIVLNATTNGNSTARFNQTTPINQTASTNATTLNITANLDPVQRYPLNSTTQANITAIGPLNLSAHYNLTTLVLSDQGLKDTPLLPQYLKYLDLSYNNLTGPAPGFMLANLETAFFQHNNFTLLNPPPYSAITTVSVQGNTHLHGWFWGQTCEQLTSCDLRGTVMQKTETCEACHEDTLLVRNEETKAAP